MLRCDFLHPSAERKQSGLNWLAVSVLTHDESFRSRANQRGCFAFTFQIRFQRSGILAAGMPQIMTTGLLREDCEEPQTQRGAANISRGKRPTVSYDCELEF